MDCNAGCFWFHEFIPLSGSFAHHSARTAWLELRGQWGTGVARKRGSARTPCGCRTTARDQRLKNARVEKSSMLCRLTRDGFSEIEGSKFQGFAGSKVSR